MEATHKKRIQERFPHHLEGTELYVLDIPDDYQFMDPELIEELKLSITPILESMGHG